MVIDIIAVLLIVICIVSGVKKGFIKTAFGTLSLAIAILLTVYTLTPAVNFVSGTKIGKSIYERTEIKLMQEQPEGENSLVSILGVDKAIETAQDNASEQVGNIVLRALCAAVLFTLYSLVLWLLINILDAIAKLPVLNTINKLGGFLAGAINAYILMMIFSCILLFLISTAVGNTIGLQLEQSVIMSWLSKNNIFMKGILL